MAQTGTGVFSVQNLLQHRDMVLSAGIVGILFVMLVPLPPIVLDLLLTLNIALAMLIILITMYVRAPLEFSVFPTLLLITTLFRLALNVASTRLILLHAYAGEVIQSFGTFVVGGNYIVGIIIFLIIIVIQFVVITRGAGRISEVAARFMLDAMPGKQMAIDADLNAGLITEEQARKRRKGIEEEADFYGAMDGATKFVRGDAIAGIIITIINILGGLVVGVMQLGMTLGEAAATYTILTVGDGLVAQIPALLISTAAGIITTRSTTEMDLSSGIAEQTVAYPRALLVATGMMFVLGLIPGLPTVPFLLVAAGVLGLYYGVTQAETRERVEEEDRVIREARAAAPAREPENVEALLQVDTMEVEIGYALIPIADPNQGGDLLERITGIRRQAALKLGIVVPPIRIRDNMSLKPNQYHIKIRGVPTAEGELLMGQVLAMNAGLVTERLAGVETREPAFGLEAVWVSPSQREHAEQAGYTVADPATVLATHLTEIINVHAADLLGRQETSKLMDNLKVTASALVEELVPGVMTLGEVQAVLRNLLRERVSIRNLETILEVLADMGRRIKDPLVLTEYARQALAATICHDLVDEQRQLHVMTLDPQLEQTLSDSVRETDGQLQLVLEPGLAQRLVAAIQQEAEQMTAQGQQPVVLTAPRVRPHLRRLSAASLPSLVVLSYNEVLPEVQLRSERMVGLNRAS